MKPATNDTYLPCGWTKEVTDEDRIAFTREDCRLTLIAELVEEDAAMARVNVGPVWRIQCEQHAGEAESGIPMGCVTTMNTAMETLLKYMRRITEMSESGEDISVGTMIELLGTELAPDHRDDWGRNPSSSLDTHPPSL